MFNQLVERYVVAGIDPDAVVGDAEVQMVAGGDAGSPGCTDRLSGTDNLTRFDIGGAQVHDSCRPHCPSRRR